MPVANSATDVNKLKNGFQVQILKLSSLSALSQTTGEFATIKLAVDPASGGRFLIINAELSLREKHKKRFWIDFLCDGTAIGWMSSLDVLAKAQDDAAAVRVICSFVVPPDITSATMRFVSDDDVPVHLFAIDFGADFECTPLDPRCEMVGVAKGDGARLLIVGGMAKSGTTWIARALNCHPEILMLNEAELFCDLEPVKLALQMPATLPDYIDLKRTATGALDRAIIANVRQGLSATSLLYRVSGLEVVGDKSPAYAFFYEKLLNLCAGLRIVHCERNPADGFVSRIYHDAMIYKQDPALLHPAINKEAIGMFEAGVLDLDEAINLDRWKGPLENLIEIYAMEYWFVRRQVDLAKNLFPTRIYIIHYENCLANPEYEFDKMLSFVGNSSNKRIINEIVRLSSFRSMSGGRTNGQADFSSFFRRGVSGDARRLLGSKGLALFDKLLGKFSQTSAPEDSFVSDLVRLNQIN